MGNTILVISGSIQIAKAMTQIASSVMIKLKLEVIGLNLYGTYRCTYNNRLMQPCEDLFFPQSESLLPSPVNIKESTRNQTNLKQSGLTRIVRSSI